MEQRQSDSRDLAHNRGDDPNLYLDGARFKSCVLSKDLPILLLLGIDLAAYPVL